MRVAPPPPPVKSGEESTIKGKINLPYYYSDHLQIYMFAAFNNIQYKFVMKFDSPKLYRKMRKFVFYNHNNSLLVFGTWYTEGCHSFYTDITDESQITAV